MPSHQNSEPGFLNPIPIHSVILRFQKSKRIKYCNSLKRLRELIKVEEIVTCLSQLSAAHEINTGT